MSTIQVTSATFSSGLMDILGADDIEPGAAPGYQLCKLLWTVHPLGGKLVEKPVALALGKERKINVPGALEEQLVKAFRKEWAALGATDKIRDVMHLSRAYGSAAIAYGFPNLETDKPLTSHFQLASKAGLYFNIFDPLNLAGSMVTNQNPNAPDFQKPQSRITAAGQPYHPSRTVSMFNGTPIYLDYQSSSFSFSGRSIFLRALYPMKSFINTMKMNDLVAAKAGLLIEKIEQNSSIMSGLVERVTGLKRNLLKRGMNGDVLSIGVDDDIQSLNLQNIDGAMTTARDNIISDVAAATDVPAILIKDESFAKGLASGDQDMLAVVQYIDGIRTQAQPLFDFFDRIVMYRAWNAEFFVALQNEYPEELKGRAYLDWFYETCDLFEAEWESLIQEDDSVRTERNSKKLDAVQKFLGTTLAVADPVNKGNLLAWAAEVINDMPELFSATLTIDPDAMANYEPPQPEGGAFGSGKDGE